MAYTLRCPDSGTFGFAFNLEEALQMVKDHQKNWHPLGVGMKLTPVFGGHSIMVWGEFSYV